MGSYNSQNANNDSEVMPSHELHKLNHLANSVTCQTKLKSSKHQDVHLLDNLFTRQLHDCAQQT